MRWWPWPRKVPDEPLEVALAREHSYRLIKVQAELVDIRGRLEVLQSHQEEVEEKNVVRASTAGKLIAQGNAEAHVAHDNLRGLIMTVADKQVCVSCCVEREKRAKARYDKLRREKRLTKRRR